MHPLEQDGPAWQGVELASRLYAVKGWGTLRVGEGYAAGSIPSENPTMQFRGNGSITRIDPGDLVIFNSTRDAPDGRVGIVDAVGPAVVRIVEQGAPQPRTTLHLVGATLSGNVRGVVHSPGNQSAGTSSQPVVLTLDTNDHLFAKRLGGSTSTVQANGVTSFSAANGPQGSAQPVLATRTQNGRVYLKQSLSGPWVLEGAGAQAVKVQSDPKYGVALAVLTREGHLRLKRGVNGRWTTVMSDVKAMSMAPGGKSGPALAALTRSGSVLVRTNSASDWTLQAEGARNVAIARSKDGLAVAILTSRSRVLMKTGLLSSWVWQGRGIRQFALSGSEACSATLATVTNDHRVFLKTGAQGAWHRRSAGALAVALTTTSGCHTGVAIESDDHRVQAGLVSTGLSDVRAVGYRVSIVG